MNNGFENRQMISGNSGYVTPEMYGAAGDGITDDSTAFQDAVDSGSIVLCTGSYKIAGITLAANTYLKGNNCTLVPIYGNSGAVSTMFYGEDIGTALFEGLRFEGTYPVSIEAAYTQPLICIDGGEKVSIIGCSFVNIDGSSPSQYSCEEDKDHFWGKHGQVIDIKGVFDTYIIECTLNNPSARETVWIMPNSNDLSDINVYINGICFYSCVGETPLNVLCQNVKLNNLFFDSACSFNGSAINALAKVVVSDGIIVNGFLGQKPDI